MTFDEFLDKVCSEPERAKEIVVNVPSPELLREVEERRGMPMTEFIADPRKTRERRLLRKGHVLGPPLTADEVREWQRRWPRHVLPADLAALLLRVNGIHLWADLDAGRSYEGLAPLGEWDLARAKMYGPNAPVDSVSDHYLALTYHADAAAFVVLNVDSGGYFLMDSAGPDESCRVGRSADDLLDYLWRSRIP